MLPSAVLATSASFALEHQPCVPALLQSATWLGGSPAGSLGPSLQLLRCLQQTRCASA